MEQFKWGTDEVHDPLWEGPGGPDPNRRALTWRRLSVAFVVFGLVAGAIWGAKRLATNTIDQAEQEIRAEVLGSHRLIRQAEQEKDRELLTNLISGRSRSWVSAQSELFQSDLWFDRPTLLLTKEDDEIRSSPPPTITLASDLNTATVETIIPYRAGHDARPINLVRTEIFRRGANGWLLAPLDTPEWRSSARFNSPVLEATFPLADREIGERLTVDLSQTLIHLCEQSFELDCDLLDTPFSINFSVDPQALLDLEIQLAEPHIGQIDRLPAPTLVGRPIDENGYETLLEGYASILFSGWLLEQEEAVWDGDPWMAAAAAHIRLNQMLPTTSVEGSLNRPIVRAAEQDIALLCLEPAGVDLVRLSGKNELYERLSSGFTASNIHVDQADERLMIQGIGPDFGRAKIWPLDVQDFPVDLDLSLQEGDKLSLKDHPRGTAILLQTMDNRQNPELILLLCGVRSCRTSFESLPAQVFWSPDGRQTVTTGPDIFLGDQRGEPIRFIGEGYTPHWVDPDTVRYVGPYANSATGSSRETGFWEYHISFRRHELLTTSNALQEQMFAEDQPAQPLSIWGAFPLIDDQTLLFVESGGTLGLILFRESAGGSTRAVWRADNPQLFSFFSDPNGRYLVLNQRHPDGHTVLELVDLESGASRLIGQGNSQLLQASPESVAIDWSQNGDQLLIVTPGEVMVFEPASNQLAYWPLPDSLTGCFDGRWIGPQQ